MIKQLKGSTKSRVLGVPRSLFLAVMAAGALHCSGSADATEDDQVDTTEDEILGGTLTWAEPEIGKFLIPDGGGTDLCTATLITNRVAITAAHCVDYGSRSVSGLGYKFVVRKVTAPRTVSTYTYSVSRYKSLGTSAGRDDIAVLQLSSTVPSTVAHPASMVDSHPGSNDYATVWGWGCINRSTEAELGSYKRYVVYHPGVPTSVGCPGDSGGPRIDSTGAIFELTSAYQPVLGYDIVADVSANMGRIVQVMVGWAG